MKGRVNHRWALLGLFIMACAGVILFLMGELLPPSFRAEATAWLDSHQEEAERFSGRHLPCPKWRTTWLRTELPCEEVRPFEDAVAFTLRFGGFKGLSRGLCFSISGKPPPLGLGETALTAWERFRGSWYLWAAE